MFLDNLFGKNVTTSTTQTTGPAPMANTTTFFLIIGLITVVLVIVFTLQPHSETSSK